jgi:hypothetical protein
MRQVGPRHRETDDTRPSAPGALKQRRILVMSNTRLGFSLLVLGLAIGPIGCPSDPVCPTCGLELSTSSKSATLSLRRSARFAADELLATNVTVYGGDGTSEAHQYTPDRVPLSPGQTSRLVDPELYSVGERVTVKAEVAMTFRRQDTSTFTTSSEIAVRTLE